MHYQLVSSLTLFAVLASCSVNEPRISVVCDENPRYGQGNCMLKWEIQPPIEGKVQIYFSTSPDNIPEKEPVLVTDISDQYAKIVTGDPTQRYYYKLVFNNTFRVITASHNVVIPGIQNFRDIGGYYASKGKKTRWGMLYRSARIQEVTSGSLEELKNIGIKTIIDLRVPKETIGLPAMEDYGFDVVHIPIAAVDILNVFKALRENTLSRDSVYRLTDEIARKMILNNPQEFKQMFDVLLDKERYPALITCATGIGKTGLASSLLFYALGVYEDQTIYDYLRNNDYFDIPHITKFGYGLPVEGQEAITAFFTARESTLRAAWKQAEESCGSMAAYLSERIGLSASDIGVLRAILLN